MSDVREEVREALPLPHCRCDAHYSNGSAKLCREIRERDHARQADALTPIVERLVTEARAEGRRAGYERGRVAVSGKIREFLDATVVCRYHGTALQEDDCRECFSAAAIRVYDESLREALDEVSNAPQ